LRGEVRDLADELTALLSSDSADLARAEGRDADGARTKG
jgi:hypothetical protein